MLDTYSQRLLDQFACRQLIETYWYAEGVRDPELLVSLFATDGRWGSAVGHDALLAQAGAFFTMMGPIAKSPTGSGGINVDVSGDQATGFAHGIAHLVIPQPLGETKIVVVDAIYDLGFRREAGEWRIAKMTGVEAPDAPHDASFQFEAPGTAIDFGMPDTAAHAT